MADPSTLGAILLLTITGTGQTSVVRLDTPAQCLAAAHLVVTGITAEDDRKQAEALAQIRKDEQAKQQAEAKAWATAHPPRQPKNDDEQRAVDQCLKARDDKGRSPGYFSGISGMYQITSECVVQDDQLPSISISMGGTVFDPARSFGIMIGGRQTYRPIQSIKQAWCFDAEGAPIKDPDAPVIFN